MSPPAAQPSRPALTASAARTDALGYPVFRPGKVISVKFTDFAPPGCMTQTLFGPPGDEGVKTILQRLGRGPSDVSVQAMKLGDVAVVTARPGEPRRPLAFIWEGLTAPELNAALDRLASARP
jgi:hypothetical protein